MSAFEPGSHEAAVALEALQYETAERLRPCVLFGARLNANPTPSAAFAGPAGDPGRRWVAVKDGLAVEGDTPADAMRNFDQAWQGKPCEKVMKVPGREPDTWTYPQCIREPGHAGACKNPVGPVPELS